MRSLLIPLLLAAGTLSGCIDITPSGTFFASDPPGARILVDGRDSGWVTPCLIDLDEDEPHAVRIELSGFSAREVELGTHRRLHFIPWWYGVNSINIRGRFPLFLPTFDLLMPYRENDALSPARIFVHLRPEGGA